MTDPAWQPRYLDALILLRAASNEVSARKIIGAMLHKWGLKGDQDKACLIIEAAERFNRENQRTGGLNDAVPWLREACKAWGNNVPPDPVPAQREGSTDGLRAIGELVSVRRP